MINIFHILIIKEYLISKTVVIVTHRPKIKAICTKAYKFTDGILGKEEKLNWNEWLEWNWKDYYFL